MVMFASLLGAAALYAGVVSASPMPDNNVGELAVSAPNGTPLSDTQTATATASSEAWQTSAASYGDSYGGSSGNQYDNSGSSSSSTWSSAGSQYTPSSSYGESGSSYGSGSSSWGGSGYDSCVQQCVASFGAPSASAYISTQTTSAEGSSGTGTTHTVWVAPTQGVLRYVPFATNASVGDTIKFVWGGNAHTVTKSSILGICNKTSDAPFASGTHNTSFVFTQVVNDTNPTFFYCGTPNHCQKGMFGIINPPNAFGQPAAASNMIPSLASNSSSTSAAMSYASNATSTNSGAANWGQNIDMSGLPSWAHAYAAENILYTRSFLGENPEVLNTDGTIDMGKAANNALMIPSDVAAAAAGSNNAAAPPPAAASSTPASSAAASASPVGAAKGNGAGVLGSPRVVVAFVAVAAAFFAL